MAFLFMICFVALAFFFCGMIWKEETVRCVENSWNRLTMSKAEREWIAKNGKNYKTLAEARHAWLQNEGAAKDREAAQARYQSFLSGICHSCAEKAAPEEKKPDASGESAGKISGDGE